MSNDLLTVVSNLARKVEQMTDRLAQLESADGCLVGALRTVNTTDATVTTLHTVTITQGGVYYIEARVAARRTGGSAGAAEDGAGYLVSATLNNPTGAAAALVGAVAALVTQESQAGWACTIDVSGNTARVRVTGAVNNNVTWVARCLVLRASA